MIQTQTRVDSNSGSFAGRCVNCNTQLRVSDVYERLPNGEPLCRPCHERAVYWSDPFNIDYERARARGWSD